MCVCVAIVFMGWKICNNPNFHLTSGVHIWKWILHAICHLRRCHAVRMARHTVRTSKCIRRSSKQIYTHTQKRVRAGSLALVSRDYHWNDAAGLRLLTFLYGCMVHRLYVLILMLFMYLGISAWTPHEMRVARRRRQHQLVL